MVVSRFRAFALGAAIGAGGACLLLASGAPVPFVPLWQAILFYPGLWVGMRVYSVLQPPILDASLAEVIAKAIGVLAVAVSYGVYAIAFARLAAFLASRQRLRASLRAS